MNEQLHTAVCAIGLLCIICLLALGTGWLHEAEQVTEEQLPESVPFAECFVRYAPQLGWDWQTLAAVAWHESHFNPRAHSHAGACGVMQLMPRTAKRFGLNDSTIWVGEDNIRAGVEYITFLQGKWSFIQNKEEQTKFVLASYNSGPKPIFAARQRAKENGVNPYVWNQVEPYVHSATTRNYVKHVLKTANKYRNDYTER